jgi:hypothetical protein
MTRGAHGFGTATVLAEADFEESGNREQRNREAELR